MNRFFKFSLIIIIIIAPFSSNAQTTKERLFIETGYTYFNGSFGEIGARFDVADKAGFFIGANALIGGSNGKILVIPEINATKYFDMNSSKMQYPFARLAVSPKSITPQIGFGIIIGEIAVGYGFSLSDSPHYKTSGFRVGLNFNIPIGLKFKIM